MNIILAIGAGIEADAGDVAQFFEHVAADAKAVVSPQGLLGLAILAGVVLPAIESGASAAAADGLNFTADASTAALLVKLGPALKAYFLSLAVQPKGTS